MNWLNAREYERIHFLVTELSIIVRKRHPRKPWSCYTAVNHNFSGMRLVESINGLITRAVANMPMRPLEVMTDMVQRESVNQVLLVEFLECFNFFKKQGRAPAKTDWERISNLLLQYRNYLTFRKGEPSRTLLELRVGKLSGEPMAIAYAAFLEVCREDQEWCRRNHQGYWELDFWVKTRLQKLSLIRRLTRLFESSEALAHTQKKYGNAALEAKRKSDRERQAKHRKKTRKKRDII